jgi:hypothetical protein
MVVETDMVEPCRFQNGHLTGKLVRKCMLSEGVCLNDAPGILTPLSRPRGHPHLERVT